MNCTCRQVRIMPILLGRAIYGGTGTLYMTRNDQMREGLPVVIEKTGPVEPLQGRQSQGGGSIRKRKLLAINRLI